jgi:16S rRNA processing protein RimM
MTHKEYFKAGFVMRAHGLKGEVTISVDPDSPADWDSLKSISIDFKGTLVPYFIEQVSVRGDKAFVKLEDINTPEQAARLKNHSLYLPKTSRPKPESGDFYDDELIGFDVYDVELGQIGAVTDIERAGINRFLIIKHKQKEIMIPAYKPLLKSINRSKKVVTVDLPEGFLDI